MSNLIRTLELRDLSLIAFRDIKQTELVRSLNIDQITGNFAVTKPLNLTRPLIIYPQSPNNPSASFIEKIKYLYEFSGYGLLNFTLDAKFDYARSKLWLADAGNNRILQLNSSTFNVGLEIKSIILPCVVCPNINTGGVFVMAFIDGDTGVIYHYDQNGVLVASTTYPIVPSFGSIDIVATSVFINKLPLSSSMAFDHTRNRLWWANNGIIYMMDTRNKQIITKNLLSDNYVSTSGIDIEFNSGNCFVVAKKERESIRYQYWTLQISKDNSKILSSTYIAENTNMQNTGGITTADNAVYPSQLIFSDFANPVINGTWDYISDMGYYNNMSYFLFKNYKNEIYDGTSGFMAWGKYVAQQDMWRFFIAQYDLYPVISTLWIYAKSSISPYGVYTLEYYDNIFDQPNLYPGDHGILK